MHGRLESPGEAVPEARCWEERGGFGSQGVGCAFLAGCQGLEVGVVDPGALCLRQEASVVGSWSVALLSPATEVILSATMR